VAEIRRPESRFQTAEIHDRRQRLERILNTSTLFFVTLVLQSLHSTTHRNAIEWIAPVARHQLNADPLNEIARQQASLYCLQLATRSSTRLTVHIQSIGGRTLSLPCAIPNVEKCSSFDQSVNGRIRDSQAGEIGPCRQVAFFC